MANTPKRIVGLRWEEISGVDHPANEEEGWLVMKAAGSPKESPEGEKEATDERLDELIASEMIASDEVESPKGVGQIIGRLVERVLNSVHKKPAKKYSKEDIAVAIKANAAEFVADLAKIVNEKGLSKSEVSEKVSEAVKSLQTAVEIELNKEDE